MQQPAGQAGRHPARQAGGNLLQAGVQSDRLLRDQGPPMRLGRIGEKPTERRLRGPVVARKNFYGSGSLWSGRLAAMLFSLFQTIQLWGMNVGRWLTSYLSACANAKGKPPPDPQRYLPWNMTCQQREHLSVATPKSPDAKPLNTSAPNASPE